MVVAFVNAPRGDERQQSKRHYQHDRQQILAVHSQVVLGREPDHVPPSAAPSRPARDAWGSRGRFDPEVGHRLCRSQPIRLHNPAWDCGLPR